MELYKEIEKIMGKHKEDFSGVVLVKNNKDIIYSKAYGYAHRGWKIPNNIDTRFDTASITKLFTTVGILQLIDKGDISFDTKVIDFLNIKETTISNEVNIFHLLTHTSGIALSFLWMIQIEYCVWTRVAVMQELIMTSTIF